MVAGTGKKSVYIVLAIAPLHPNVAVYRTLQLPFLQSYTQLFYCFVCGVFLSSPCTRLVIVFANFFLPHICFVWPWFSALRSSFYHSVVCALTVILTWPSKLTHASRSCGLFAFSRNISHLCSALCSHFCIPPPLLISWCSKLVFRCARSTHLHSNAIQSYSSIGGDWHETTSRGRLKGCRAYWHQKPRQVVKNVLHAFRIFSAVALCDVFLCKHRRAGYPGYLNGKWTEQKENLNQFDWMNSVYAGSYGSL